MNGALKFLAVFREECGVQFLDTHIIDIVDDLTFSSSLSEHRLRFYEP